MKKQVRNNYTDNIEEDLRSFMVPLYLSRISSVRFIDTDVIIKLNLTTKSVYGYLAGIGYCVDTIVSTLIYLRSVNTWQSVRNP